MLPRGPQRQCPEWGVFTSRWDKPRKPLASLAQGSKTSLQSPQIFICCWKIALGNDVDQRSKFSVKINFSSEQSKIQKKKKKTPRCFISLLLTFFNIYHRCTLWARLSVEALNYREVSGISLERISSASFYKQKLWITDVLQRAGGF